MGQNTKTQHHEHQEHLDLPPEEALFGSLDGLIATFYSNERPLQGLSGLLDWYFHGAISSYLRAGAMSGNSGECAYLPLQLLSEKGEKYGKVYHLLLVGGGTSPSPGRRQPIDDSTYAALKKNILSLKIPKLGISLSDFGNISKETLARHFKEVPLWIVR